MSFHLGKPILVMLIIAVIGTVAVSIRSAQQPADLDVWVFAEGHHRAFAGVVEQFETNHDITINCNLVQFRALNVRLGGLFMADPESPALPDLVEIEIGTVGKYFRPPVEDIGFIPLNGYLKRNGWDEKIVQARLSAYTKDGLVFGIPHDVHPVAICYREDLFSEAGIDLSSAKTWPQFHDRCMQFEAYWQSKGMPYRHAIELPEADSGYIVVMLLQRHINLVDHDNNIHLADPRVAETVAFYAQMVAGPRAVAGQSSNIGRGSAAQDLNNGNLCAFITPDWRFTYLRLDGPSLTGKMRMMPLPIFDKGDSPTSTWGGTMMGITRGCENPDLAWKLLEALYFSEEGLRERLEIGTILPPIKSLWDDPAFHKPEPFTGGQRVFELYTQLAAQLPERIVTPATAVAQGELTYVLNSAVSYIRDRGNANGLEAHCQQWLEERADNLRRRIEHMSFEEVDSVGPAEGSY